MNNSYDDVYATLYKIYEKHRRKYHNPDSKQMVCVCSCDNPPDIISHTPAFYDIQNAFDIDLDEDAAYEIYEMMLDQAAEKIMEILNAAK